VGLPGLILFMEWRGQRTGDVAYRLLARRLARALGVLFAVGAVSGTILSFEMGLLWSGGLMEHYGSVIGLPFAIEGFRLLRRSDLSRHLLVWLGAALAAHPSVVRDPDSHRRRIVGVLCRVRQRVDEQPPRVH